MSPLAERIAKLSPQQRELLGRWLASSPRQEGPAAAGRKQIAAYVTIKDSGQAEAALELLQRELKEKLPGFMVPDSITILDTLPRLPNGKLNVHKLPQPEKRSGSESSADTSSSNPLNETEQTLLDIWKELLHAEMLGVHDNFYEFGGDSIISIQVISRAREAGLEVEPKHLAERPTVAELAQVVKRKSESRRPNTGKTVGKERATPIQQWFLQRQLAVPEHWNQCRLFDVADTVSPTTLKRAIEICVDHHDALRSCFLLEQRDEGDAWMQLIDEPDTKWVSIEHKVATSEKEWRQGLAELQQGFSIADLSSPLMRFAIFEEASKLTLAIVAHHLLMDQVSWGILLEDLQQACQQIVDDSEPSLPTKTTSILEWVKQLHQWAALDEARSSLEFWNSQVSQTAASIPRDKVPRGEITEGSAKSVTINLGPADTAKLQQSNEAYQTRTQDLLLTALAQTLNHWRSADSTQIDLEGHGRDLELATVDVSRTIGWLTSFFPMRLDLQGSPSVGASIKSIKEQRSKLPHRGLSYGVLRYLSEDANTANLRLQPIADVLFNYSGIQQGGRAGDILQPRSARDEVVQMGANLARSPENVRSHLLEINASIDAGELILDWTYSDLVHDRATIKSRAEHFLERLRRLIAHCQSPEAGGFTPSDFPDVDLSQTELDDILDELE